MLEQITPLVITYNEAANIERTLSKLSWARRIVVVDSGSTDSTSDIVLRFPQAEIMCRPFDDFAAQCNFGLANIYSEWALSLDADYELSDSLVTELTALQPGHEVSGYKARFIYRVYGRALSGTLYPARVVLYRKARAHYHNDGHGHRVSIQGKTLPLVGRIYHDDRKPLSRWFSSQQIYARREAEHLLLSRKGDLAAIDRLRLMALPAPMLVLVYVLLVKGCLLDGWPGWFYALQRTFAEIMIALEIVDRERLTKVR